MPICVAGMHRSGTSMIMNMLHVAGVNVGPADRLFPPLPDNPRGFWEKKEFVALNNEILARLGGSSVEPPEMKSDWLEHVNDLAAKAQRLIDSFSGREPWGWKDPRNCLTLPFWERLLPDLKVVICLRHPLEVALSLRHRMRDSNRRRFGPFSPAVWAGLSTLGRLRGTPPSPEWAFRIWEKYNRGLVSYANRTGSIVTRYESYFSQPRREVERVLRFLKLPVSAPLLDSACEVVTPDLRHEQFTRAENLEMPPRLEPLYQELLRHADASVSQDAGSPEATFAPPS